MEQRHTLERLLTPNEIKDILGLKRSCVYRLLRSGVLPSIKVTGKRKLSLRVKPSALERWLKAREIGRGE